MELEQIHLWGLNFLLRLLQPAFDVKEEEVEVVVGIGEDETLDSISNTKQKKHSNLKTLNERFFTTIYV